MVACCNDEALWTMLATWASFQPRGALPRSAPGRLFYPSEYSHVFEKYWDYLPDLSQHPDFASESQYCQEQMRRFSSSLSALNLSEFQPSPSAEAKQSDLETAEEAAISSLRPMQEVPIFGEST
jgi:hypothetical protein